MRALSQRTVRGRLGAIVLFVALLQVALLAVGVGEEHRIRADLRAIQAEYLPLIDLGSDAHSRFVALTKSLQDAVTSQDLDALAATEAQKDALVARLDEAPASVPRDALTRLEAQIDDWYARASDLSRRLIRGESGLQLTSDIAAMQQRQREVEAGLQSTVGLDRSRLTAAFQQIRRRLDESRNIRLILRVALSMAVIVICLALARQILRSLAALAAGLERFGRGEFGEPVEVVGDDELAEVARVANRMAASLAQLDRRLRARQEDLERANRELESFSYSVSHDLRAPLRAIDGFSKAVLDDCGADLPEKGKGYLQRVRAAAQRMGQLIDDMLRLSRIGRSELRPSEVDVATLARDLARELQRADPDRQVELAITGPIVVRADPRLLAIALENLLSNAWKFSSKVEHPRVEVGPLSEDGCRGFYVKDNGAGFEMSYASRLFTPFQRLHDAGEFPGTGIGLATVQRVAHRHGGRVRAEGEVGRGARFSMLLPDEAALDDRDG